MKRPVPVTFLALLLVTPSAHAGTLGHSWSQRFGSTGADQTNGVVVDAQGNIIVAGGFNGTANMGGTDLISAGSTDIYVAKYDASGNHLWSVRFGGASSEIALGVAVDLADNIFVAGSFSGTINMGGSDLVSAGGSDIFIAKLAPTNGAHVWSTRVGGAGTENMTGMVVDGLNNVLITGNFLATTNLGGVNLTSAGSFDIFVAKYNNNGVHQWSVRFGGTGSDGGQGIAADAAGIVYFTGTMSATVDFGGGNLISAGATDVFLAKLSVAGVHQWSQRFGSAGTDQGLDVVFDAAGTSVIACGSFTTSIDFGGGALTSAGDIDIYITKFNSSGVHQWSRRFGGVGADTATWISVAGDGAASISGTFTGTVDFGSRTLTSAGGTDVFVARHDAAGAPTGCRRFGDAGSNDLARGIANDGAGNILVSGFLQTTVDYGGGNLVSAGNRDIFIAKYAPENEEPAIASIEDIGNDQGRQVKVRLSRSAYDGATLNATVTTYEVYRRDDAPPATLIAGAPASQAPLDNGWTFAGDLPAHGQPTYALDVPTIGDSTIALGQYTSAFFVRAATAASLVFYDSPPDSGYSLDNLAPGVPSGFAYNTGQLSWDESAAADFDYFTVYGSNADNFGTATLVDYGVSPAMDVTASPYVFYYVTATDFSGNEGNAAKINTLSGTGGTPTSYVLSVSNYPNPFNPRTTVSYTVPSRATVTVAIFDARGARVTTLVNGEERSAGAYRVDWNGQTDAGGVVSSGVYFVRIEHNGTTRSKKMVLLK